MIKNEHELSETEAKRLLKQALIEEFKDSFNEILNIPQEQFFDIFQRRVEIIIHDSNKSLDASLSKNTSLLIEGIKDILEDYYLPVKFLCNKALNEYKALRNPSKQMALYLAKFNPHCFNNKIAHHTCKGMFILAKDNNGTNVLVICEKCSSCYYVECIRMYCDECDCEFLSCEDKNNDLVYPPATWSKYHCSVAFNQQMTCGICKEFLFIKGNMIYCKKCKIEQKPEEIEWKCMICRKYFHSDAKIYNPLEFVEIKLAVKNALVSKMLIKPTSLPCGCDNNPLKLGYYHKENCKGIPFSGDISKKKIIVCSLCKMFCALNKYRWICPICKVPFRTIQTRIFKMEDTKTKYRDFNRSATQKVMDKNALPMALNRKKKHVKSPSLLSESAGFHRTKELFKEPDSSVFNLVTIDNYKQEVIDTTITEPKTRSDVQTISNLEEEKSQFTSSNAQNQFLSPQEKKKKKFTNQSTEIKETDHLDFFNKKASTIDKEQDDDEDALQQFNIDDYTIFSQLGQGTYGKIYLVEDKENNLFSMKKLIISDKEHFLSLTREYDIYAKYKHNHILSILGISKKKLDMTTYSIYILMEVGITDWEKEIEQRKLRNHYYPQKELIMILRQLTSAMVYLQRNHVSHRDIKAQNILVFKNRVFKIADFGEARKFGRQDQKLLTLRGTELYMAPVLYNGLQSRTFDVKHNPYKSDVYSLGLCMVFGATLNLKDLVPFRDITDDEKVCQYVDGLLNKRYSSGFIELISSMVSVDEDTRPDFIEVEEYLMQATF